MRICMVASSYPRYPGDFAGSFVQALARALVARGHDVGVVAPADPSVVAASEDAIPVRRFSYSPFRSVQPMGYGKALEGDQRLRWSAYACAAPYLLSGLATTRRAVVRWRSQVVHAHWVLPNGPLAAAAAHSAGVPMVTTLHGSDLYLALRSAPLRWLAASSLRASRLVTSCSPDLLQGARVLGAAESKLSLIPWGGDIARFAAGNGQAQRDRWGIHSARPVVLAVGRMVEKKGFAHLLRAFQQMLASCEVEPQTTPLLVLAGEGAQRADLVAMQVALGLGDNVQFCGQVSVDELPDVMAAADVVVVPSVVDGSGNQDGLPTVALEAMAAGKPVVASALGGLPLVVQDGCTGLLVPPGDEPTLAEAILTLVRAPAMAQRMGKAAHERVERDLSWDTAAQQYETVYERALAR